MVIIMYTTLYLSSLPEASLLEKLKFLARYLEFGIYSGQRGIVGISGI